MLNNIPIFVKVITIIYIILTILMYIGLFKNYPINLHTIFIPLQFFIFFIVGIGLYYLIILDYFHIKDNDSGWLFADIFCYIWNIGIIMTMITKAQLLIAGKQRIVNRQIVNGKENTITFAPKIKENENWTENTNEKEHFSVKNKEEFIEYLQKCNYPKPIIELVKRTPEDKINLKGLLMDGINDSAKSLNEMEKNDPNFTSEIEYYENKQSKEDWD